MSDIPSTPGSYALHLYLPESATLNVGKSGRQLFPARQYVYLGSAYNPGGLRARLGRHWRGAGKLHWHIDYLRSVSEVTGIHFIEQTAERSRFRKNPVECRWSQSLANLPQAAIPAPGFGASDCRSGCPAHLIAFLEPDESQFNDWLAEFLMRHTPEYPVRSLSLR